METPPCRFAAVPPLRGGLYIASLLEGGARRAEGVPPSKREGDREAVEGVSINNNENIKKIPLAGLGGAQQKECVGCRFYLRDWEDRRAKF